jgi:hypothetical protein
MLLKTLKEAGYNNLYLKAFEYSRIERSGEDSIEDNIEEKNLSNAFFWGNTEEHESFWSELSSIYEKNTDVVSRIQNVIMHYGYTEKFKRSIDFNKGVAVVRNGLFYDE